MYFILQNVEKLVRTTIIKLTVHLFAKGEKQHPADQESKTVRLKIANTVPGDIPLSTLTQFNIPSHTALDIVKFQPSAQQQALPDIIQRVLTASANAQLLRGQEIVAVMVGKRGLNPNEAIYFALAEQPDKLYGIYAFIYSPKIA
jgi:hypothetical protein